MVSSDRLTQNMSQVNLTEAQLRESYLASLQIQYQAILSYPGKLLFFFHSLPSLEYKYKFKLIQKCDRNLK